jgi:hypothetical protein
LPIFCVKKSQTPFKAYLYTLKKDKPDIICCSFPDFYRMEIYDEGVDDFINMTPSDKEFKTHKPYMELITSQQALYMFIKNLKFIELICHYHNIKFYWVKVGTKGYIFMKEEKKGKTRICIFIQLSDAKYIHTYC